MKKTLKSIKSKYGMLNESYAWERQEGKPLPTLADVQEKYNAKSVNEQEKQSLNEGVPIKDMTWSELSEMMNRAKKENTILKFEWSGGDYPLYVSIKNLEYGRENNMAIDITGM